MHCNKCGENNTSVVETRAWDDGKSTRRRRSCNHCANRFTTYEKIEIINMLVEKSGTKKERYNRQKLEWSILKAIDKRSISIGKVTSIIADLEFQFTGKESVTSKEIGTYTLALLKNIDEVAYVRYASIYQSFDKAQDYVDFIEQNITK